MIATSVANLLSLWNISTSTTFRQAQQLQLLSTSVSVWANHLRCLLNRAHSSVSLPSLGPCLTDGMDSLSLATCKSLQTYGPHPEGMLLEEEELNPGG